MRNTTVLPDRRGAGPPPAAQYGAALTGALLVALLVTAVTAGLTALVVADSRVRPVDGTRQAFYTAQAGLEKLTADLGDLFASTYAPTGAQVLALMTAPPSLGNRWVAVNGSSGYTISFPADSRGNPAVSMATVSSGPFQGLVGEATPFTLTVTARLPDGSDASLTRTLQAVALPVFQFGIFAEHDLALFADADFNFGGRVHSNGNIFLAEGTGATLTLPDRVTAVGEIIRSQLANGQASAPEYGGRVRAATAPNAYRTLATDEGSVVAGPESAPNEPKWTNLSTGAYNHNLMSGRTGAKPLSLAISAHGGSPIDLIRRPAVHEDVGAPNVLAARFYSLASLRILLSDTPDDITGLPGVDSTVAPVPLMGAGPGSLALPFAASPEQSAGPTNPGFGVRAGSPGTPLIGGYIKIEKQTAPGVWQDVTLEILNLGVASRQVSVANSATNECPDLAPNAIVRLQRPRSTFARAGVGSGCQLSLPERAEDWSPNVLFDAREGELRDRRSNTGRPAAVEPARFGGLMHYVELDARNLSLWLRGAMPGGAACPAGGCTGANALNVGGYTVYFSDRRGNRRGHDETGESIGPLSGAAERAAVAERNPPVFSRRALKVTHGASPNLVAPGLTIASENPVYLRGTWNADGSAFDTRPCAVNPCASGTHVATAFIADAVTLLSNNWNDYSSLVAPFDLSQRPATTTWYRLAVMAGTGRTFPQVRTQGDREYGTDGGVQNLLRSLENWAGQTQHVRGSLTSLFYSRQATGPYKCCADVFAPPARAYSFDADFLTPSLLPPRTPVFRDINLTGVAQIIRP